MLVVFRYLAATVLGFVALSFTSCIDLASSALHVSVSERRDLPPEEETRLQAEIDRRLDYYRRAAGESPVNPSFGYDPGDIHAQNADAWRLKREKPSPDMVPAGAIPFVSRRIVFVPLPDSEVDRRVKRWARDVDQTMASPLPSDSRYVVRLDGYVAVVTVVSLGEVRVDVYERSGTVIAWGTSEGSGFFRADNATTGEAGAPPSPDDGGRGPSAPIAGMVAPDSGTTTFHVPLELQNALSRLDVLLSAR